jgi:hypothetical protein
MAVNNFTELASFSVSAFGTPPLAYHWRKNGVNIGDATNSTFIFNSSFVHDSGNFDVVVSNYAGSVTSSVAILQVNPALGTVVLNNYTQVYNGTAWLVTASTTPTNLALAFTYNGNINGPSNAGIYTVIGTITDPNYQGIATNFLVINPAVAILALSNLTQISNGTARAVTVTTIPAGLQVSNMYNNSSTVPINAGSYQVVATVVDPNYTGSATNTLIIYPQLPTILQHPGSKTVARGSVVSFNVSAVGSPPFHYQWRSNFVNIASATNSVLILNNVETNASAGYRVVITNAYGSVTSSVAQLTVFLEYSALRLDCKGLGTITGATNNQILTIGNFYKLSAKSAKGFLFKNWTDGLINSLTNSTKLSFLMRSNLSLTANFIETSLPKLIITSPLKNAKLNGSYIGMNGTASDAWAVTNVSYSVNNGGWNAASTENDYSNWTATVTLAAGTNTIRVYAQNQGGLSSLTNSLKVIATNVLTLNLVINSQNQAPMRARAMAVAVPASKGFTFSLEFSAGVPGHIEYSTDLVHWTTWTNFDGSSTLLQFNDPQAGESSRFYRAVTP